MLFYYEDELKYYKVHLKLILNKEDWWYHVYHHISVLFLQFFFYKNNLTYRYEDTVICLFLL